MVKDKVDLACKGNIKLYICSVKSGENAKRQVMKKVKNLTTKLEELEEV